MSRNPAIAKEYFEDYMHEIKATDSLILSRKNKTIEVSPPRYFSKLLEKQDPIALEHIKTNRLKKRQRLNKQFTESQAEVSKTIKQIKMQKVTRDFEDYHE